MKKHFGEKKMIDSLNRETRNDVVYRHIGSDFTNGILACGFMEKKDASKSQYNFVIGYYSCFVLLRGKGFYVDASGCRTAINPGDVVQRLPQAVHSTEIIPDGEWLEFFISFGYETYKNLNDLGLIDSERPVFHIMPAKSDYILFDNLLCGMKAAAEEELPGYLFEAQKIVTHIHKSAKKQDLQHTAVVSEALQLLGRNLEKDLSPIEVAKKLNIGYESFRKLFKKETGLSPFAYRTNRRIAQARLLLSAGVSISETAVMVGYPSCYSFSKQFKKSVGINPRSFQRNQMG